MTTDQAWRERQRAELWTWQLVAAIAAATQVSRVIEVHPGGDQYDVVQLHMGAQPRGERGPLFLDCNRRGRVHVFRKGGESAARALLDDIDHGLPMQEAVAWVRRAAGVSATPTPGPLAASLATMAEILANGIRAAPRRLWEWRNGCLDSPGYCSGRDELFRAVPAADVARVAEREDLLAIPEYRFWFLQADEEPVLAVQPQMGRLYVDGVDLSLEELAAKERWERAINGDSYARVMSGAKAHDLSARRRAFQHTAEDIAGRLSLSTQRFEPPGAVLTQKAHWLLDSSGGALIVVVGEHEDQNVADEVLAYALAWQGDHDLVLILPESHVGLVLQRLPWVGIPVRVFLYGAALEPRPAVVPSRAEVMQGAAACPLRPTIHHELGQRANWIAALVQSADDHWALVPAHRHSYLSWHCAGRQVLRISRSGAGLRILAGVAYRDPPPGESKPLDVPIAGDLTPDQRAEIEARVATAIWKRLANLDAGHVEHRFQAALAASALNSLELTQFSREYPAWRGEGRPGFIDFLGLDRRSRIHVVETKVGTRDVKVVLQTLDYAIWVAAKDAQIREDKGWPGPGAEKFPVLDFVLSARGVGGTGRAVGPYLAGQLEALAGDLPWRIFTVDDPLSTIPKISGPWTRRLSLDGLDVPSVGPPRWASQVEDALKGQKG